MARQIEIVIHATVELADADAYPEGMSLVECARFDYDADPAAFFMDQVRDSTLAFTPSTPVQADPGRDADGR